MKDKKTKTRRKITRKVPLARAYIAATFNNTFINITDLEGNTLAWSSGGDAGFKGNKRGTPFAGQSAVKNVVDKVRDYGIDKVDVFVQGPWLAGRDAAIRSLHNSRLRINSITDVSPLPHNGVRPPKKRKKN